MTQIFTGAPVWVWPLLGVLVSVGVRARRERWVPAAMIYALPVLGVLALRNTAGLPVGAWIWGVFMLAYLAGAWGGYVVQGSWIPGREGFRVRLAGESLTLTVLMLVFWANFIGGFVQAVAPGVYGSTVFALFFATMTAAAGGSFAGRALRVWRWAVRGLGGIEFPIGGKVCDGARKLPLSQHLLS